MTIQIIQNHGYSSRDYTTIASKDFRVCCSCSFNVYSSCNNVTSFSYIDSTNSMSDDASGLGW